MSHSNSAATFESAKDSSSTTAPHMPVRKPTPEGETDRASTFGVRAVTAVGGNSPQTPPVHFASLLGHASGSPSTQAAVLRQLQRRYGNSYVGQVIQAKLEINQPGDVYEQEADQVAEQVMRMPKPAVQRKCAACEAGLPCTTCTAGQNRRIRRKTQPGSNTAGQSAPEGTLTNLGPGKPLDTATRASFEPRFGRDFSGVRVHADSESGHAAVQLNAQAFTSGRDIYFGEGRYQPNAPQGQRLLAHELTHVLQQTPQQASTANPPGGQIERKISPAANAIMTSTTPPMIQRFGLGDVLSVVESGAEWAGGKIATGAGYAWEGAKWAGGKFWEGSKAAWECAKATGRSIWNILTLDVSSIFDFLGISKPAEGSPGALDTILLVLRHPCLMMIPGYSLLVDQIAKLESVRSFLRGAWHIMQNPGEIIDALKEALGGMIAQVPSTAGTIAIRAITFSEPSEEHLKGIWRHLEPKLEYLANNWWGVIKEAGWDLLWPWPGVWSDLQQIWEHIKSGGSNLWDLNISEAVDDLLAVWRTANSVIGRLYGWFFIAAVLIGAILGAIFGGGVGAIPGALAGAGIAAEVGMALLISVVIAEASSIGKAGFDLVFQEQTEEEKEEDYEQIANSGLTLAITGVMAAVSALAVRFARGLVAHVRGLFRKKPTTPQERLAVRRTEQSEKVRVKEIEERIKKLDDDIAKGKKTIPKEDLDWLNADPRRKELAFDKDIGSYRVNEAKAALAAEKQGSLPRPVRRATSSGDDFIDGTGKVWDHKGVDPSLSVNEAARELVGRATAVGGENILADLSAMNPAKAALIRARTMAQLAGTPNAGRVVFVPAGPSPATVGGGVVGQEIGEQLKEQKEK